MIDEEYTALAEEYALQSCAMSKHKGKKLKQLYEDSLLDFYEVFDFLYKKNLIKGLEYKDFDSIFDYDERGKN